MPRNAIRPVIMGLFVLALLLPAFAALAQESPDCATGLDYARRAQASLEEQQFDTAIEALTCLIEQEPENWEAYLARAEAVLRRGALTGDIGPDVTADLTAVYSNAPELLDEKVAALTEALAEEPDDVGALAVRAYLYWYTHRDEQAIADYTSILSNDRDNVYAYVYRGITQHYLGRTAKARGDFDRALEQANGDAGVPALIASVYDYSGNTQDAIDYYTLAIEMDPENPDYYISRGNQYQVLQDLENVTADFTRAIELAPDYAYGYQARGWALSDLGQYDAAIADFDQAVALDPTDLWSFLGRATARQRQGELAAAAPDFAAYVELMEQESRSARLLNGLTALDMTEGLVYRIPLALEAGQQVTITATSPDGLVDPLIVLFDRQGTPVRGSDDISLEDLNAAIDDFEVPQTGDYTLLVTHAGAGSEGEVEVRLTVD